MVLNMGLDGSAQDGFIIVDKPPKVICHELTARIKKLFGVRAGHAGTLDPDVSGVLPIALGKSTRLLQYISSNKKKYVGIIKFKNKSISDDEVKSLFAEFTGRIWQTPPLISAVKKIKRKRTIYYITLIERHGPFVLFETEVEAGTYIRTLCDDIGKKCGGARMEELRRTAVGRITEKDAVNLHKLADFYKQDRLKDVIRPPYEFIDFPRVHINLETAKAVLNGAVIARNGIVSFERFGVQELVSVFCKNLFVGVGSSLVRSKELENLKSGFVISMKRVHVSINELQ